MGVTRGAARALLAIALAVVPLAGCARGDQAASADPPPPARSSIAPVPVQVVATNGGWCWWQSPRAILTRGGELLVASTPSTQGAGGRSRDNDVSALDVADGTTETWTLLSDRLSSDDHNSGALLELPSGRVVTAWAGHSEEPYVHVAWRDPGDADWTVRPPIHRPETDVSLPSNGFGSRARVTYANLIWVETAESEGRLYDLFRGRGDQPVAMVSDDQGATWTYLGEILSRPGSRPYLHYAASGSRIWFTASLGHPEFEAANPLLAGYIEGDEVFRTDGTRLGAVGDGVDPARLTVLFRDESRQPLSWDPDSEEDLTDVDAWGSDLTITPDGTPAATFTVRRPRRADVPGDHFAHDLYWTRLDPAKGEWNVQRVAHAGSDIIDGQPSYTGLAATDPTHPARIYLSTDVHPETGRALVSARTGRVQHEIWEGTSDDDGRTWTWLAVTQDSVRDNLRPTVAAAHHTWALSWLRGRYTRFTDGYDQEVVAIVRPDP